MSDRELAVRDAVRERWMEINRDILCDICKLKKDAFSGVVHELTKAETYSVTVVPFDYSPRMFRGVDSRLRRLLAALSTKVALKTVRLECNDGSSAIRALVMQHLSSLETLQLAGNFGPLGGPRTCLLPFSNCLIFHV